MHDGKPTITETGYDETTQALTFEANPPAATGRLDPKDCLLIDHCYTAGKTLDARPVKAVHVEFRNESYAEIGARALAMVRGKSYYVDADGKRTEVTYT